MLTPIRTLEDHGNRYRALVFKLLDRPDDGKVSLETVEAMVAMRPLSLDLAATLESTGGETREERYLRLALEYYKAEAECPSEEMIATLPERAWTMADALMREGEKRHPIFPKLIRTCEGCGSTITNPNVEACPTCLRETRR